MEKNQQLPPPPSQPAITSQSQSTLKTISLALGMFLVGGGFGVAINSLFFPPTKNDSQPITPSYQAAPSPIVPPPSDTPAFSVRINPYQLDIEDDQLVATFRIEDLNQIDKISTITYWTDQAGACHSKTTPFTELVKIPVDNVDYSFFRFTDINGNNSEIFAASHEPVFQCGQLVQ